MPARVESSSHPNIEIANRFYEAGIPVRVFITPILPYIMDMDAVIGAIRPEINIYLDKLRVFKKGNQHTQIYARIQSEYPMYADNYHKILFEENEDYYQDLVRRYKNNKQIIFMTELWEE